MLLERDWEYCLLDGDLKETKLWFFRHSPRANRGRSERKEQARQQSIEALLGQGWELLWLGESGGCLLGRPDKRLGFASNPSSDRGDIGSPA
jgi:hypothetical protein